MSHFGSNIAPWMAQASYSKDGWSVPRLQAADSLPLHPASHVLHYASSCFEGLKAFRRADGGLHLFRPDRHIQRMCNSARQLCLPVPDSELLMHMLQLTVGGQAELVPDYPGALYLRPLLLAADVNIGGAGTASATATLLVMAAPVGDYFGGSDTTLRLLIEQEHARTTPDFGQVKTGGNYAAALQHIVRARRDFQCDQVLFCPAGDVQETGAANFFLLHDNTLITKHLDGSILPGITRDSLLRVAASLGFKTEERTLTVEELLKKAPRAEAALSGTAAVFTAVGELVYDGHGIRVGNGGVGEMTRRLRSELLRIQSGVPREYPDWIVEC